MFQLDKYTPSVKKQFSLIFVMDYAMRRAPVWLSDLSFPTNRYFILYRNQRKLVP